MSDPKPLSDAEREALARDLVGEQMEVAPAVERPVAILTAGQPGSGKGMIVNRVSVNFEGMGAPPVVIDPDEVRLNLSYMRDFIARGDLNIPGAAYVDAGTVASKMVGMAAEGGRNIVYDGTLANTHYARLSVDHLKANNYRVEIHGMATAPELSHASTYERRELQIKSSPTGFGRGVGDEFHDQAVEGVVETIRALQADGKVDAIVLYDRQGKVVGSTRFEEGRWVPDEQMADAMKAVQQNPDRETLQDAAHSWDEAASMMRDRGADEAEQRKVDGFRDAASARVNQPASPTAGMTAPSASDDAGEAANERLDALIRRREERGAPSIRLDLGSDSRRDPPSPNPTIDSPETERKSPGHRR